jgi:hypothetical protein
MARPQPCWYGSGADDDFAEGATLTDVCQGLRDVVEAERAEDMDLDVVDDALLGKGSEVFGALLHREQPQAASVEPKRLTEVASTWTSTWLGPGVGVGTTSTRSTAGGPYRS